VAYHALHNDSVFPSYETMGNQMAMTSNLSRIERELGRADDYSSWKSLAEEHDTHSGQAKWRAKAESTLYDYKNIQFRLDELKQLRVNNDDMGLLFNLNEGIHGNQGGMGSPKLYEKSMIGTKHIIEDYIKEVTDALRYLHALPVSEQITREDKEDFFDRAHLCFGRSALMLSGAGSLGHFHHGVVRTLFDNGLLPKVISGSSAGSIFAAVLGTHTDAELKVLLPNIDLSNSLEIEEYEGTKRPQVDAATLVNLLETVVPNLTFQEAYEKTGRMISVTIAPLEEHQKSRLMNSITAPNVFIRSAVTASCAVPGLFPPVMLMAKNVYGEPQPYIASRRWVDGAVTDDLPAKRLARLYGVNHYIVSQANPLALAMMSGNKFLVPDAARSFVQMSTREWLRAGEKFSRRYLRNIPNVGQAMSMFYSVMAQDYTGDVNIAPSFHFVDPQKLMGRLTSEEIAGLIEEGERATWQKLAQIRICTEVGRTLDEILDTHDEHNVKSFYKRRGAPKKNPAYKKRAESKKTSAIPK
jgi:TAG lipase/steryl ester hydrolase/phospholipase A2/LPA acyltransferase